MRLAVQRRKQGELVRVPSRWSRRRMLAAAGASGLAFALRGRARAAVPVCVAFGHGYVAGEGASSPDSAFPALVARQFGWQLVVDGVEGSDVDWRADGNTRPGSSGLERVQSRVIVASPDVLIIMFGLTVFGGRVPLDQYQADYWRLLHELREAGISPVLCV